MLKAIAFAQLYASVDGKPRSRFRGEHHGRAHIVDDDSAVPRVPKDTSAAGAAIAAQPLPMAVSGDLLFWDEHLAMPWRRESLGSGSPPLVGDASGNPSWLFRFTAKPHFQLRAAAATQCAA
jgi:hypothetical protein